MISFPVTDKKQGENLLISEQIHNFADGRQKDDGIGLPSLTPPKGGEQMVNGSNFGS